MKSEYIKPIIQIMDFHLRERIAVDCRMWGDGYRTPSDPACLNNEPYTEYGAENNCIPEDGPAYGIS